mgnify:CR=1 FL=1
MEKEIEKLEKLEKGIQELANVVQKMKDTIKWYEDYAKVVYTNKPNVDQYACDYADEQQELRNK